MLLSELTISNIGPFSAPTKVLLEPGVTVLTGANDSGKSSVLSAIELLCGITGRSAILDELQVNLDRIGSAATDWKKDTEIWCEAIFDTTEFSTPHLKREMASGGEISLRVQLAPECRQMTNLKFRQKKGEGGWSTGGSVAVKRFPTTIRLPLQEPIRTIIDLAAPNQAEAEFLRAAFGSQFSFEKYKTLSEGAFYAAVSKARGDTNAKLRRLLPSAAKMEFDFQTVNGERGRLSVQLRDQYEGHTPIGIRGAGVQRLVSLMGVLLSHELDDQHYIILVDEPETSLHADAQHTLRAFLEGLADKPNIQVVYATHSPSMINPVRPASLRLVERDNDGQIAQSRINHRPVDENYLSIRSSLGISPSDSLLYAPLTIVVEGPSEVIGLPLILGRLWKESIPGFEDTGQLLSHVHFLDGCGDSFEQLCRFAYSQGTKPIVFLDGDKAGSRLNKLNDKLPEVPVILLEGRSEFEEIIDREVYFESLATVMAEFSDKASSELTVEKFDSWQSTCGLPEQMAFSKRVDRWVQDSIGLSIEKPLVMKHALQATPLDSVKHSKLLELVKRIRETLL